MQCSLPRASTALLTAWLALAPLDDSTAAPLSAPEASLDASLRRGSLPELAPTAGARVRAAHAAVAASLGRRERAQRTLSSVEGFAEDCAHRARRTELGIGTPCESIEPSPLQEAVLLEPPTAFALVAARPGEDGRLLVSKVLVEALDALAPEGGLQVETTADRFRITGRSALEGVWYLEDRMLIAARPGRDLPEDEALAALARLLALRGGVEPPEELAGDLGAEPEPMAPPSVRTEVLGWSLELPAGFVPSTVVPNAFVPLDRREASMPIVAGAVLVQPRAEPARERERRARRNPMARRRGGIVEQPPPDRQALPTGSELVEATELFGGVRELAWKGSDGTRHESLLRVVEDAGREVVIVVHLGAELDGDRAMALLAGVRPVR